MHLQLIYLMTDVSSEGFCFFGNPFDFKTKKTQKLEDKNSTKTGSQLTMGQVGSWWFPRFGHFPNWDTAALWVYWRVYPPGKLTWLWITHHLKLYFLLKMRILQCHVGFWGYTTYQNLSTVPWSETAQLYTTVERILNSQRTQPKNAGWFWRCFLSDMFFASMFF